VRGFSHRRAFVRVEPSGSARLFEGALDTGKEGGKFYEFVFEGGEVLFLEPFDMD